MSDLEPSELVKAMEFIENGNFKEASQVLQNYGEREDLSQHEQISYYIVMSFLSDKLEDKQKLSEFAEKAYQASQGQTASFQLVDVNLVKSAAYFSAYKYEEALALLLQGEKILKSLNLDSMRETIKRKAMIFCRRANIYFMIRKFDKAIENAEQSLELYKNLDIRLGLVESLAVLKNVYHTIGEFEKSFEYLTQCLSHAKDIDYKAQVLNCYIHFGIVYAFRGEVDIAIEHYNKALEISKEIDHKFGIAQSLNNLGDLYRKQGHFNLARDTLEKSVEIFKELGISGVTALDCLFHLALEADKLELAEKYLKQLEEIKDRSKFSSTAYRVDRAVFLKTSPRSINRGKAEEILKQIVEGEIVDYEITIIALLHLCDLLIYELQNTGDLEIIDEIKPCINKILDLSEKNHSYPLLVEVYILQARLALVTLELKEAPKLLTKAQHIADTYHLDRLAVKISAEHDELLKQLNKWEGINESNTSLRDRMKLASLNEQMDRMISNREFELTELKGEEPIVLMIMDKSGISYLTYAFSKDVDIDWRFSSFMSAFDTFSYEVFSESIDRIKIGENLILINPIESFLVCYVIKGQSYLGLKKLNLFSKFVKDNTEIWTSLKSAAQTGQELNLKTLPSLATVIKEIFK